MLSTWILIMWLNGTQGNASMQHVEFSSEERCLKAQTDVLEKDRHLGGVHKVFTVCVEK